MVAYERRLMCYSLSTKPEVLVAKENILAALVTVLDTNSSLLANNVFNQMLWTENNLVLVKCSDIMSNQNMKLAGHISNLVGQYPITDCYFQPRSKVDALFVHWKMYM